MRFIWPLVDYIVTRGFYYKSNLYVGGQHAALDLIRKTGLTNGSLIRATAAGMVSGNGWDKYSGNFISVDHADGWSSHYRHLVELSRTGVGRRVVQGEAIGVVGNTGVSQGSHLHFDLWCTTRHDDTAFPKRGIWAHDPKLYLGKEDDDMALTAEQHAMLQTIHHFAKISGPAILAATLAQAKAAHAHAKAANSNAAAANARCKSIEAKIDALAVNGGGAHSH